MHPLHDRLILASDLFCPFGRIALLRTYHVQSLKSLTAASVWRFQRQLVNFCWTLSPFRKVWTYHDDSLFYPATSVLYLRITSLSLIREYYRFLSDLSLVQ
jgi:hypothetical protein